MKSVLRSAFYVFGEHSGWIAWNLFLAFVPLVISLWLFRWQHRRRSFAWWLWLGIFMAFLPNTAYLLTDIIHLIDAIRAGYSVWITTLVFIPLHLLAVFLGWEAYVLSVINQSSYLVKQGAKKYVFVSEICTHAASAVGIYLGRFLRFNSWDLVTKPDIVLTGTLDQLSRREPLLVMAITFAILTVLYWLTKQITLGTALRMRSLKHNSGSL